MRLNGRPSVQPVDFEVNAPASRITRGIRQRYRPLLPHTQNETTKGNSC